MKVKLLQRLIEAAEGTEVKMLESLVQMAESLAENYPAKVSPIEKLCWQASPEFYTPMCAPGMSSKQSIHTIN